MPLQQLVHIQRPLMAMRCHVIYIMQEPPLESLLLLPMLAKLLSELAIMKLFRMYHNEGRFQLSWLTPLFADVPTSIIH